MVRAKFQVISVEPVEGSETKRIVLEPRWARQLLEKGGGPVTASAVLFEG